MKQIKLKLDNVAQRYDGKIMDKYIGLVEKDKRGLGLWIDMSYKDKQDQWTDIFIDLTYEMNQSQFKDF